MIFISIRNFIYLFTSLNINLKPYYSNRTRIEPEQKQRDRKYPVSKAFQSLNVPNFLFKLAESSLILVILMQLSIPFSIDNSYLSTHYFSFHIFLVPIQYHCIFSLLCVVPVACRFVYYSHNNILSVCLSTYGNYNLKRYFCKKNFVVLIVSTTIVFYVLSKINYLCWLSLSSNP